MERLKDLRLEELFLKLTKLQCQNYKKYYEYTMFTELICKNNSKYHRINPISKK